MQSGRLFLGSVDVYLVERCQKKQMMPSYLRLPLSGSPHSEELRDCSPVCTSFVSMVGGSGGCKEIFDSV